MRRRVLILAAAAFVVAACAGASAPTKFDSAARPAVDAGAARAVGAPQAVPAAQGPENQAGNPGVLGVRFQSDRVLVLNANLDLRALDPWAASDRIQLIALDAGGDVVSLAQSGRGDDRSASITIRVPNERFNAVLAQLKGLEGVELVTAQVRGEDKTEQFIDLDARLKAKQQEEQRYLALLARADKIDDILKIDQVLAQVRAQIEQLTGQLNALKNRSAMATITATVSSLTPPLKATPGGWQPARTFQAALASLAGFLTNFADLAIWAAVWLWLPALALLGVTLAIRRRPARA